MPSFWLGLLLIQLFALQLHWLPTSGYGDLRHLVLPAVTLAAILLPNFVLITRAAMLELMGEQFVVTGAVEGPVPRPGAGDCMSCPTRRTRC